MSDNQNNLNNEENFTNQPNCDNSTNETGEWNNQQYDNNMNNQRDDQQYDNKWGNQRNSQQYGNKWSNQGNEQQYGNRWNNQRDDDQQQYGNKQSNQGNKQQYGNKWDNQRNDQQYGNNGKYNRENNNMNSPQYNNDGQYGNNGQYNRENNNMNSPQYNNDGQYENNFQHNNRWNNQQYGNGNRQGYDNMNNQRPNRYNNRGGYGRGRGRGGYSRGRGGFRNNGRGGYRPFGTRNNDRGGMQFNDRGLDYNEKILRDYLYYYLEEKLVTEIEQNKNEWEDFVSLDVKEDDIINNAFKGNPRANVYDLLTKTTSFGKRESNPISSSLFKAISGYNPYNRDDGGKVYGGYQIHSLNIKPSPFSEFVWVIRIRLRDIQQPSNMQYDKLVRNNDKPYTPRTMEEKVEVDEPNNNSIQLNTTKKAELKKDVSWAQHIKESANDKPTEDFDDSNNNWNDMLKDN